MVRVKNSTFHFRFCALSFTSMITKILIFTLLALSSTSALLENLFQRESTCYSGCQSNYADQTSFADACKKGCDYKLHNEKCADQCDLVSSDSQLKASCLVGCSMVDSMAPQVRRRRTRSSNSTCRLSGSRTSSFDHSDSSSSTSSSSNAFVQQGPSGILPRYDSTDEHRCLG